MATKRKTQKKQHDWTWQWSNYKQDKHDVFLLQEWMHPNRFSDFEGKKVLDCGCGRGGHLEILSSHIKEGIGIDLNASQCANRNFRQKGILNAKAIQGDLATIDLQSEFDIVYSIGVLQHTDDPTRSFDNIKRFCKKGGRVIVWVYSYEGNFLNRTLLEFLKRQIFLKMPKRMLAWTSKVMTASLYIPIYTIYLLPLKALPFYEYFSNWRRMSFYRNDLNVFDKLNAPTTHFIRKKTIGRWFNKDEFRDVHISMYKGVSWRGSGTKR